MFKTDIASFEQEFPENDVNLNKDNMNSKYVLLNNKIISITTQLKEYLIRHGIEVFNWTEMEVIDDIILDS